MADEFHLNGDKGPEALDETDPELDTALKKLNELNRPGSPIISMSKQDVTLLKQMLHAPDTGDEFTKIVMICDFLDEDERNRELDAFWEAKRLGMDTNYNIDHALSCASINRKGAHRNSRVAALLDSLSHQKITSNMPKGKESSGRNPNSPLG